MRQDIKQKWVEALRSGKYAQGKYRLRRSGDDGDKFCCLGVLCDVFDATRWSPFANNYRFNGDEDYELLPDSMRDALGIGAQAEKELAALNDDEDRDFAAIADHIEKNL